jgi:hypothetical protein
MIVKLIQNGTALYVNSDQMAIVSPHPQLINQTNVTLGTGINVLVEGAASEIAVLFGYKAAWVTE